MGVKNDWKTGVYASEECEISAADDSWSKIPNMQYQNFEWKFYFPWVLESKNYHFSK